MWRTLARLVPGQQQFRQWTLPSKLTALGVLLTVVLALLGIVYSTAVAIFQYWQAEKADSASRTYGRLASITRIYNDGSQDLVDVEFGVSGTRVACPISGPDASFTLQFPKRFSTLALRLAAKDGRVVVSTKIRDSKGAVVAEVNENEWKLNVGHFYQRNYTDNAFEVVDVRGHVVLQLVLLPDRIRFQGRTFVAEGYEVMIFGPPDRRGKGAVFTDLPSEMTGIKEPIPRMFLYPSELHLGQLSGAASFMFDPDSVTADDVAERNRIFELILSNCREQTMQLNLGFDEKECLGIAKGISMTSDEFKTPCVRSEWNERDDGIVVDVCKGADGQLTLQVLGRRPRNGERAQSQPDIHR